MSDMFRVNFKWVYTVIQHLTLMRFNGLEDTGIIDPFRSILCIDWNN